MYTIDRIVGSTVRLDLLTADGGLPRGYRGGKLPLLGGGQIAMPREAEDLHLAPLEDSSPAPLSDGRAATAAAMSRGRVAFRTCLEPPAGLRFHPGGNGRTRVYGNAVALEQDGVEHYGIVHMVLHENAVRPGRHAVEVLKEAWLRDREDFAVMLARTLADDCVDLRIEPEPGEPKWSTLAWLIEGPRPAQWEETVRALRIVAGLYSTRLRVEFEADARFQDLAKSLAQSPPKALFARGGAIRSLTGIVKAYQTANPAGYVETYSPKSDAPSDGMAELAQHLAQFRELSREQPSSVTWAQAKELITAECSTSNGAFELSDRAAEQLADNPYPDPERMVNHLRLLAKAAREYRRRGGDLGGRVVQFLQEFGLSAALFDSDLRPPIVRVSGVETTLSAEPHIKVDDFVSPDRCGRIYFAIDHDGLRFVIDHVGLHDYGM